MQQLMFKLDQNPKGRGLRCDGDGLFLGRDALLQKDGEGNFQARSDVELQKTFSRTYGSEAWESQIRSVKLVANAMNKGDMARAMMTAVLMRLPPGDPVRIADVDGALAKTGYDPDEPRDERGRWTNSGGGKPTPNTAHRDPRIQLATDARSDAPNDPVAEAVTHAAAEARQNSATAHPQAKPVDSEHENFWQALGSSLSHDAKSALSQIGRAEVAESSANLSQATAGANAIAHALKAYADYHEQTWVGPDGRPIEVPVINTGDPVSDQAALMGHDLFEPNAPLTRPGKNGDWLDPLFNLATLFSMGAGQALRLVGPAAELADAAAEAIDGAELSANAVQTTFETTEGVAVKGARAIDRGASYEIGVRKLYRDVPLSERQFQTFVDGRQINGVADNAAEIDGKLTAVDAKYVDTWTASLRNPASEFGDEPWAVAEQQQMIRQAKAYSSNFPGGVIYHTNSVDLATYYANAFRKAGITNFRFVITPATKLRKTMTAKSMEEILGVGAFETERKVPGTRPGEEESVRYISFDDIASVSELFSSVAWKVEPPMMKSGGVVLEGTTLELPDGRRFFAVLLNDDLEGWRKQIEQGASELGRATAKVLAGNVIVSDGRSYPLASCKTEFDYRIAPPSGG